MTFKKFTDELRVYFYAHLYHKDLFLYNYAAELNVVGDYMESQQIALECDSLWADYDLQMLIGVNCLQLQQYSETETYLRKAAAMCPVKFMPLFQLTKLYQETERQEEAQELAQIILDKEVKIASPVINSIKNKMRYLLNELSNLSDLSQIVKSKMELTATYSWQDYLLDVRIPKAILPT